MDRQVIQRLVYSMVQFLRSQLENESSSGLQEEGIESVEVAMQCLETAYGVTQGNSELAVSRSLYDIFSEATKTERPIQASTAGVTESKPVSEEDKAEAEDLKNQGNQLMREEKFTQALDAYTKAISKNSSNGVYYCNRAAAHSKLLNHKDAIEDCKRALQVEPQYSKAYGRMGLAYSSLNDHQKAKECYQKALELEPDNESYKGNLNIAEEKIRSQPQAPPNPFAAFASGGGGGGFPLGALGNMAGMGGPGGPDVGGLLNNPALMNMATQLMSDPNMQNMMSNFMSGMGGGGGAGAGGPAAAASFMNGLGGMGGLGGGAAPPGVPPPAYTPPVSGGVVGGVADGGSAAPEAPAPGMEALLTAGRQLAEQMQNQHPDLVEQIRSQMNRNGNPGSGDGQNQQPPPGTS